jgi:tRNA (cmo5U34)-methyltransferase
MAQFHWDPDTYLAMMQDEVPGYERFEDEVARASGHGARRVLELGVGTGETTLRLLERHPDAEVVGIDASAAMLDRAARRLPEERVDLRVAHIEDPLPEGRFDLVVSALAVHHLGGEAKADLFVRVARVLAPGGRLVLGDVVIPDDPDDAVAPIDPAHDFPSRVEDQLAWLADAGLDAHVCWQERDLAVIGSG